MLDISCVLFAYHRTPNHKLDEFVEIINQNSIILNKENVRCFVDEKMFKKNLQVNKIYAKFDKKRVWTAYKIENYQNKVVNFDADLFLNKLNLQTINNFINKNLNNKFIMTNFYTTSSPLRIKLRKQIFLKFDLDWNISPTSFAVFYTNDKNFLDTYKSYPLEIEYYEKLLKYKFSEDEKFELACIREEDLGIALAKKLNLDCFMLNYYHKQQIMNYNIEKAMYVQQPHLIIQS